MQYVIMLDKDLAAYQNDWPIIKRSDNIVALRQETQWSGNPELVPRANCNMDKLEGKSLTDAQTGSVYTGGIYKKTPKA